MSKYKVNTFEAMPKPAVNLSKRALSLAQQGDGIHTLILVITKEGWRVSVNGRPAEFLGEVDNKADN
jgi:hypothetical protein